LGRQSAKLLLKQIEHPGVPTASVVLPTQLIRRESCSSPAIHRAEALAANR
jgi:DNA-binding LacI/PurR family transcriptional regulator